MSAIFTKMRDSIPSGRASSLDANPIMEAFEIGEYRCAVGHELVWKVYDAVRIGDRWNGSVLIADKRKLDKIYKLKRNEMLITRLKKFIKVLDYDFTDKTLRIVHDFTEGPTSVAFACEGIIASLYNILLWHEVMTVAPHPPVLTTPLSLRYGYCYASNAAKPARTPPPNSIEYHFMEIELRFGLIQIIQALHKTHCVLHLIHRNICPSVILVTRTGVWKLFGFELSEIIPCDSSGTINVAPWTPNLKRIVQPNLDFTAPEVQTYGHCSTLSDMFSLGLVICAIYNNGKPFIAANNNTVLYSKQMQNLQYMVSALQPRMPADLLDSVQRMVSWDPTERPSASMLLLIDYFQGVPDPVVEALQIINSTGVDNSINFPEFYGDTLMQVLPLIPKMFIWRLVWPSLSRNIHGAIDVSITFPIFWIANEASPEEFVFYVSPLIKKLVYAPGELVAKAAILKNLKMLMTRMTTEDINTDLIPHVLRSLDSKNFDLLKAALSSLEYVINDIDNECIRTILLPKLLNGLVTHKNDNTIVHLTMGVYLAVLWRLEPSQVLDFVLPTLLDIDAVSPSVVQEVIELYKILIKQENFILKLNEKEFSRSLKVIYNVVTNVESSQAIEQARDQAKKRENRYQDDEPPPFVIPKLSNRPKTLHQNQTQVSCSTGFKNKAICTGNVDAAITNYDSHFFGIRNLFTHWQLSDNALLTPKTRVAPSSASSPGGTQGRLTRLPSRRHSSTSGDQPRASVSISSCSVLKKRIPFSADASCIATPSRAAARARRPNASSFPLLWRSSLNSFRSRRSSATSQGSEILKQLTDGMSQLFKK